MKLLVTGGCGFIGSHFCRMILRERQDVQLINLDLLTYAGKKENTADFESDKRYRFVHGSITDQSLVEQVVRSGVNGIVNFAAESHVDRSLSGIPMEFIRTNLEGVAILLEASKRHSIERFLQISTDEVYGDIGEGSCTEDAPLRPNNPYSVTKAAADQMVLAYVRSFGVNAVITRSTNNYGSHQYPEKFIPVIVSKALRDEPIPVYGDGQQIRDWLYVEDNCHAILTAFENGDSGHVYNIGADNHRVNLEITRQILGLLGKPESLIRFVKDRPGHDRRYSVSWGRLKDQLGWAPQTSFEAGLKKTVDWYRKIHGLAPVV